jgi:hypothetical protein
MFKVIIDTTCIERYGQDFDNIEDATAWGSAEIENYMSAFCCIWHDGKLVKQFDHFGDII